MRLVVANHSSYPRIGDRPEQQQLRRALAAYEKRRGAPPEEAWRRAAEEAAQEQARAGAELITDGLVRREDPVGHFALPLGARPGRLRRYFDNDFYYRQPVFASSRARRRGPLALEEFRAARAAGAAKAVLTGPYTLAALSEARDRRALRKSLAAALAEEVRALAAEGAEWIQIDEPALARAPGDAGLFGPLLAPLLENRGSARLMLAVYFGPAAPLYERLCALPFDALALDFTSDREALTKKLLSRGAPRPLGLGLVDGRNARLEKLPDVLEELERLRPVLKSPENFLMPSCGLEFLPRDKAFLKLARLREARDHFHARVATMEAPPKSGPPPQGFTA